MYTAPISNGMTPNASVPPTRMFEQQVQFRVDELVSRASRLHLARPRLTLLSVLKEILRREFQGRPATRVWM